MEKSKEVKKEKKQQLSIAFDPDIVEYLKKNKGRLSLSVYANQLLGDQIDKLKKK
jgi:ABC-type uncharacterized transport system substrate-binding protein